MLKYLAVRIAAVVPLLLAVAVISFGLVGLLELRGSAAEQILQEGAGDPEAVARLEAELGLDRPLPVRFASWLGNAVQGDLGNSLFFRDAEVATLIGERIWPTLSIVAFGLTAGATIGVGFGLASALRPGGAADRALSVTSAAMIATPGFALGIFLIIIFASNLGWFEPTGYRWPGQDGWWAWFKSIVLPGFALAFPIVAVVQRQLRSSMTNALASRYVLAARARGLPMRTIVRRHAMRNAMVPTVTVIGFQAAGAVGITVAIERVFAIQGLGSLLVQAVVQRDLPIVQGGLLVATLLVALVNLLVDLTYGWLNPRIRLE